jgi:hypothetical protein
MFVVHSLCRAGLGSIQVATQLTQRPVSWSWTFVCMCGKQTLRLAQGLSHNFTQLLMAVIFASIGGSIRATLTVSLVSDLLPPHMVR